MSDLEHRADVVVVGAGTAGATVAGVLAAEGDRTVLLLEAGPDPGAFADGRWPLDLLDARTIPASHDWGYAGRGAGGQRLALERARVVGGCAAHNGCSVTWGAGRDYDEWERAGCTGWSAADMRPHLNRAAARLRTRRYTDAEITPLQDAFRSAAAALGVPARRDLDDLDAGPSVGPSPVNNPGGVRWNTAFAYLDPVRNGGHLTILANATVSRVTIEASRATGVEAIIDGSRHIVHAGEVIICAGAYGTPALMQRSGIGDPAALRRAGIAPVHALGGVGIGLHDHPVVELVFDGSALLAARNAAFPGWLPEEQMIAKLRSSETAEPFDLHVFPWIAQDHDATYGWLCYLPVALLTPRSRGRVMIRSADPAAPPAIDHAYLSEPEDLDALERGLDHVKRMAATEPLASMLGPARVTPPADADRCRWIRRTHGHYWHPVGSCRMGRADDPRTVTDPAGRVLGRDRLRVADASLMPAITRGPTNLPVVAIAERIATFIVRGTNP